MAYSLTGLTTMGYIQREFVKKTIGLLEIPSIYEDSDKTEVIDLISPIRNVTINAVFVDGTSSKTTKQFTAELDALATGQQDSTLTYTSDTLTSTIEVKVKDLDWEYIAGSPAYVNYNLVLIEANT